MSRLCAAAWAVHLPAVVAVLSTTIAPGVEMPLLAMGTYRGSLEGCTVQAAVEQWLALGGRHIDTAYDYGTQADVGAALAASRVPREEIFVTTKIPGPIGRQLVVDLVTNVSLPQLRLDYVDLVLIHFPCKDKRQFPDKCGRDEWHDERMETWEGLMDLQRAGKIRAAGVSNYNTEHLAELHEVGARPAVNQVEFHLGYHNETLLAASQALGVTLSAWGSLSGPTTGRNPGVSLSDPRLQSIAKRYNVSTAKLALRWLASKGVVPITATCSRQHAMDDIATASFELSEVDKAILDALHAPGRTAQPAILV